MVVIWGLDLRTMRWSAFKSSNMFQNTDYHMRRTKFIVYQLAMIFLVISESLGTAVLSDYLDQQSDLQNTFPGIKVFNNNYIGIASFNIFVGVFAAIVFGAAFFFELFFPARYEPRWVQNMWIGSAIFCCIAGLGDALAYTVILALHEIKLSGFDSSNSALFAALEEQKDKTPVSYRNSGRAVASVVFLWFGWMFAIASTIVMIQFYRYYRVHGPQSAHARQAEEKLSAASDVQEQSTDNSAATPHSINHVS